MSSIENRLLIPIEDERVELTDAGKNCLQSRPLLVKAVRMLRAPETAPAAERQALIGAIQAYLDDLPEPFLDEGDYEPGCLEE